MFGIGTFRHIFLERGFHLIAVSRLNREAALIVLNGPRPDPVAAALALTSTGKVVYAAAQTGVSTGGPVEAARALGLLPQALDQRIDGLPQYSLDSGHLNARVAWAAGLRGAGVTVGIVDAPADVAHPDLSGRWAGRAYDPVLNAEYTTAPDWTAAVSRMAGGSMNADNPGGLDLNHGTAVASAAVAAQNGSGIVGAAPEARFLSAAVFQPTPAGVQFVGSFGAARAVVWSVDAGAKVINLSWGSLGYDPLLKAAADYALSRGVTVVAAAGNTEVVRAKMKTMRALGLNDVIEDILITLGKQYHIIRPLARKDGLFMYYVLDKGKSNLAMSRRKLQDVEKELVI